MRRSVLLCVVPLLLLLLPARLRADVPPPNAAAELSYVLSMRDAFEAYERGEIALVREELASIRRLGLVGATERFEFRLLDQRASADWRRVAWTPEMAPKPEDFVVVPERDAWSLWRQSDRARIAELPRGESDDGFGVAVSQNAETVVLRTSSGWCWVDATIWTPGKPPEARALDAPMLLNAVAVSPDGRQIAMALHDRGVSLCEEPYWSARAVVGVHSNPSAVAVDDRGWVAVGCTDGAVLLIRFDGSVGARCAARFFAFEAEVARVEFRGSDLLVAECTDGSARAWNLVGVEARCEGPIPAVIEAFGREVAFGRMRVGEADVPAFRLACGLVASTDAVVRDAAASVRFEVDASAPLGPTAITPDGRTRATALRDGCVELTDVQTGRRLGVLNESGPVGTRPRNDEPVAFACNGNRWQSIYDIVGLAFSPDGLTLVATSDCDLLRWSLLDPPASRP